MSRTLYANIKIDCRLDGMGSVEYHWKAEPQTKNQHAKRNTLYNVQSLIRIQK